MLKRQKVIKIKNSKLREIRLNLRKILMNYFYDQESMLQALWLGAKGDEEISLLRKLEDFRQNYHDSILVCGICSKLDGDRVFIPSHKCWYCTDCLKKSLIPSLRKLKNIDS